MIDRNNVPLSLSSIDFVLNINLRGTLDFVRQLLPLMTKNQPTEPDNERGCVILVSSSAAYDGQMGQVSISYYDLPSTHTNMRRCRTLPAKAR
jgi:3-hydroxyacyl-CoA dehydrogenase/3-hydroxy-2-methylbutyryl-CoA dehydrogenase